MARRKPPIPPSGPDPRRWDKPNNGPGRVQRSPLVGTRLYGTLTDIARRLALGGEAAPRDVPGNHWDPVSRPPLLAWSNFVDCPSCKAPAEAGQTLCLLIVDGALATARVDCLRCGARYHRVCSARALRDGRPARWVPLPDERRAPKPPAQSSTETPKSSTDS